MVGRPFLAIMKAVLQLGFIFFYVTSAYVVGQIRTAQVIQEIYHGVSANEALEIEPRCTKLDQGLPRFREAKRATNDFQYRPVWNLDLAPSLRTHQFIAHDLSSDVQIVVFPSHSRAPP